MRSVKLRIGLVKHRLGLCDYGKQTLDEIKTRLEEILVVMDNDRLRLNQAKADSLIMSEKSEVLK